MKPLLLLLFSGCLITSYCHAQVIPEDERGPVTPKPTVSTSLVTVTFTTDDTCNLKINNVDYKDFVKSKTVKLPLGNHKLFFESLETGKIIRDRSFRLTKDKVTGGKFTYPVTFTQ